MDGGGRLVPRFGELLKAQRERIGLTQQGLADHATLSVRALRDMEAGRVRRPRHETVRLIADALRLEGRTRAAFEAAARQREFEAEPVAPPTAHTALVGREAETEALTRALTEHGDRLVSLVGLSGVGKSRLALEVAWRIYLGASWSVHWVACDERRSAGRPAHSGALRALTPCGRFDGLAEQVGDRPALLVLDGADDGVEAAALDELLRGCRELRVLVTARTPRGLTGEQVVPLAPLPTPASGPEHTPQALSESAAVRLLASRLRRLRPGYAPLPEDTPVLAELCRYLDGLPRALEYVAGWSLVQSPRQILRQLTDTPFTLPAPPVVPRPRGDVHQSLRTALGELTPHQLLVLDQLTAEEGDRSVEEIAAESGRPLPECLQTVHELLCRGVIRSVAADDGVRFAALNLFRVLWREARDTRRPDGAGEPAAAGLPVLEALAR
ncbi:helix-turn-helix domain-containing protein [Streptomyces celluloflavus]|uniref:helix-turn-helix domain-containing protein n=1 Tax=Streptomyces celluloflavus TaxID=58344 RepID=UPI00345FE107|nr:helix-turn-helix domain-containing protein [Streptomyces celluloflavus]